MLEFTARSQQVNHTTHFSLYDMMWHDWPLYYQTASKDMGIQAYKELSGFSQGVLRGQRYHYEFEKELPSVECNIFLHQ